MSLSSEQSNPSTEGTDTTATSIHDDDPVCIVGIGCRLPGSVNSTSRLWEFLTHQETGQGRVPPSRFNVDGFHQAHSHSPGVMDADGGYFLQEDIRQFDNGFFGINNLEATYMDPQQRKILEVVYECLEDAGVSMDGISGTDTGVFVGNFTMDHQVKQTRDLDYVHRYSATGGGATIMSNRISHVFNLQGPSLTLDTACSSSLYGLHAAVTALKADDCSSAIVAGANLINGPEQHYMTLKAGVLSPSSTCHTFDASANGYGRADGVNAIYLKRLSHALRDKDKIRAVIRATATNSNGRTPGITKPSADLQEAVIRKAYRSGNISFADTDYVECHGTGTAVGDPIEVDAIGRCFAPGRDQPLMIGSVKTNFGHSEAASGLTSIIKVAMAFERGLLPPTRGVKNLNPKLNLHNMEVLTETKPWPRSIRRASINSFGYGGANAHAVMESIDSYFVGFDYGLSSSITLDPGSSGRITMLPVSAASAKSLEVRVDQIRRGMAHLNHASLRKLAFTLSERRSNFPNRAFILAREVGNEVSEVASTEIINSEAFTSDLPFAFVFTGQGAQYAGMGKELLHSNETFDATIRGLDSVLRGLPAELAPTWTLEETILEPIETSQVNHVTRSQPLCTAIQIALVNVLRSWGIDPSAVVGHSSGEIAAAYAAGVLTSTQAILAAYFRGYAVGTLKSEGAMMAAGVNVETAQELITRRHLQDQVVIACVNSPDSVTLSGSIEGIEILLADLQNDHKFSRKLYTGGRAYHSQMMKEVGDLYENLLTEHVPQKPEHGIQPSSARWFSSVGWHGEDLNTGRQPANMARYWRENLEKPVQFKSAVENLVASGKYQLIEVGPHSALKGPIQQIRANLQLTKTALSYAPTLMRNEDSSLCLKTLAGALFMRGYSLNWCRVNEIQELSMTPLHDLEPYPWDYSAGLLWHESRPSIELRNRKHIHHELLGSRQLAGNDIDWAWRNILSLGDASWLRDHKVDGQVVFPATGYLALAMEALSQVWEGKDVVANQQLAFEFSNVNIKSALVITDQDENNAADTEIHTMLSSRKLSTISTSTQWYDFTVSSWTDKKAALHCAGSVRITEATNVANDSSVQDAGDFETWPMDRWYEALWRKGIHFGQHFNSLKTVRVDGNRTRSDAIATARLLPKVTKESGAKYAVHPITIDACLQSAIIAGSKGDIHAVQAYLPQFISECRIRIPSPELEDCEVSLHVRSTQTGVSNRQMNCTLQDGTGIPLVEFKDVRMGLYSNNAVGESTALPMDRHPCLRVHWKPDILRVEPDTEPQLRRYIDEFIADLSQTMPDLAEDDISSRVGAVVDMMGHKRPSMNVLELGGGCECKKKQFLQVLGADTTFPRYRSWKSGVLNDENEISIGEPEEQFDLVIISTHIASKEYWRRSPEKIASLVAKNGVIVTRKTDIAIDTLRGAGFKVLDIGKQILVAIRAAGTNAIQGRDVLMVYRESSSAVDSLISSLSTYLKDIAGAAQVSDVSLAEIHTASIHEDVLCISLLEMEREFLATMTQQDMDALVSITNVAKDILWLNGANFLGDMNPDLTLSGGLARSIMLEQPSLRFSILDVGAADQAASQAQKTCQDVTRALATHYYKDDREFVSKGGLLYISRFGPDAAKNNTFQRRVGTLEESIREISLASASPARLAIGKVGVTDSLHWQQLSEPPTTPPGGFVDVEVKAFSLNAKDVYGMSGRVETLNATTSLEFGGIIKAVGPGDVQGLAPGDRVVVMAPNHFSTIERVPAWSACKLLPEEDFATMATLLVSYATSLFALYDRAHLRAGESILIHSGTGALGMAAITIAQRIGATIYTTVGSQAKRDYIEREFGIPSCNIFNSRDEKFAADVQAATRGRGVDVVLNSLTGDLMHTSWACIAKFGRFVEVGKRELVDAGKLDMHKFLGNTTFTAFDLSELYHAEDEYYRDIWIDKIKEVVALYRAGAIKAGPIARFDAGNVSQAYRYFSSRDRIGKITLSLENPAELIPTAPPKHEAVFDPSKVYLLVGCLGGLGRCLSRWMMARGARNFVFLGRSGADRPQAQKLVALLQNSGATVTVVRGDVSKADDVVRAVAACEATGYCIGGVIQGAMGLHEAIFSRMTSEMWHTGIQPKWAGSWNLHHALEGHDRALDFFLLMSSVSGSIGIATETNYCASNGFLDAFAHWRRSQGKTAISVGLGMIAEVGYLHENPEIEAILLRRGIQAMSEPEFLHILDLALSDAGGDGDGTTQPLTGPAAAHILTGLELFSALKLMDQGFEVNHTTMDDPRASLLSAALEAGQEMRTRRIKDTEGENAHRSVHDVAWMKGLPSNVAVLFKPEADASSLGAAALQLIKKQFSNLILMPLDKIDERKPLAGFGVDSMIASEFRTWFWGSLKVNIPFLDLLSPTKSLNDLANAVEASLSKP